MNFQSVERLSKKFKPENGWEVFEDDWDVVAINHHWKVSLEGNSRYDDGDGYPYINLYVLIGEEGFPKYVCSYSNIKSCISYIKSCGVV